MERRLIVAVCVRIRSRSGHSTPKISHGERPSVFQSITFADSLKERKVKQDSLPDRSSIFKDSRYFQQRGCGAHTRRCGAGSAQLACKVLGEDAHSTLQLSSKAGRDESRRLSRFRFLFDRLLGRNFRLRPGRWMPGCRRRLNLFCSAAAESRD